MAKHLALILAFVLVFSSAAFAGEAWYDKVSAFGMIDVRTEFYNTAYDGDAAPDDITSSDIYVYWASLGVNVELNDYVSGVVSVVAEEVSFDDSDDFSLIIDEASITIQYPWIVTPYFVFGRGYLPVGDYTTWTCTDSTLYLLTETWETTIGVGVKMKWFDVSAWFFNGAFDTVDSDGEANDNIIDDFAIRLDVFPLAFQDKYELALGGYFLNDAFETTYDLSTTLNIGAQEDNIYLFGGYITGVFPIIDIVGVFFHAEYATTAKLDEEDTGYVDNAGDETAISAMVGEVGVGIFQFMLELGMRYEMISGVDKLGSNGFDPDYEVTQYSAISPFLNLNPLDGYSFRLQYKYGFDNEGNSDSTFLFSPVLEF